MPVGMGSMPGEGVNARRGLGSWEQQLGVRRTEGPREGHKGGSAGPQTTAGEGMALGQALPGKNSG